MHAVRNAMTVFCDLFHTGQLYRFINPPLEGAFKALCEQYTAAFKMALQTGLIG